MHWKASQPRLRSLQVVLTTMTEILNNPRLKAVIALVIAVATLSLGGLSPAGAAGVGGACGKSGITGEGYDTDSEEKAMRAAIFSWEKRARAAYSAAYGDWSRARQKFVNCRKTGIYYTCTLSAQPCP